MENQLYSNIDGLPNDTRIEADLLGSILLNNENYFLVKDILDPSFFSLPSNSELYKAMAHMMSCKKTVTESLLIEYLKSCNLIEKVGGLSVLLSLQERIITGDAVVETANKIRELFLRRRVMSMFVDGIDLCKRSHDDFHQVIINYSDSLSRLVTTGKTKSAKLFMDAFNEVIGEIIKAESTSKIPSGFSNLDFLINGGFAAGNLVILAARPSVGKTSLGMDFLHNISEGACKVMAVSLEMSIEELVIRGISRYTGISHSDIKEKRFLEYDLAALVKEAKTKVFNVIKLYLDEESHSIQSIISSIEAQHRIEPLRVVFIDYLQMIESPNYKDNKNLQISDITRKLKLLARKLKITIILASQLNREVEKREGGRPILSDLRDSGSIEQDADIVMFLYVEDVEKPNIRTLTIAKNRNGQRDVSIKLRFDGVKTSFKESNDLIAESPTSFYETQGDDN